MTAPLPGYDGASYEEWCEHYGTPEVARETADALTCWIEWGTDPTPAQQEAREWIEWGTDPSPAQREARDDLYKLLYLALRTGGALSHHLAEIAAAVDVAPSYDAWYHPDPLNDPRIP